MCDQVISVRYPNKENHERKKDETDSKGMMIYARPSGSGYPRQLVARLHMEPQRHTLSGLLSSTRTSYPTDPLKEKMVSAEYPNLFCQVQDSFATSAV